MNTSNTNWLVTLGGLVCLLVLTLFLPPILGRGLYEVPKVPEIVLPMVVIAGVVALLASLTIVSVVLASLKLSDPKKALGLPEGSVRAIIALSLIIIFIITAIFLFWYIGNPIESSANATVNNTLIYTERVKFAQQIFTTVSTLVIAVAGFYFGSRTAETAREVSEKLSLRILKPDSPVKLDGKPGTELNIEVEARGGAVFWEKQPQGDTDGKIVQVEPGTFRYTRGTNAEPNVILKFGLVDHPEVTKELIVQKPSE